MRIRTLIVDDEELARERIRRLLTGDPEVEIVGECRDGVEAAETIRELRPELVFLDVQMPGMDGFELLRRLEPESIPALVFVTAYDRYAMQAFEFLALDYLLKPFTEPRFAHALARAKRQLAGREHGELHRQVEALLESLDRRHVERLLVRQGGRISFLRVSEILWIEAQGNYVKIHAQNESPLLRRSLRALGERLDPRRFLRIQRSAIVNVDAVRDLEPLPHGEFLVRLRDGTELTSSRRFRQDLQELFDEPL